MTKWAKYTDMSTTKRVEHRPLKVTPALTKLQKELQAQGWRPRDATPSAYAVRYTDLATKAQTYEVGGLVTYYHQHDGCLLFVGLVSAASSTTVEDAIARSTVRVAGVRWAHTIPIGKGMKTQIANAAARMMKRYGEHLDDDAWVQVPYWMRAGRGGHITKIAMREFKAGNLRNPAATTRQHPYRRLAGRFLSFRGTWVLGTASVRVTESPDKVKVGHAILNVVRQPDAVELHNPVLEQPVWSFHPDEFARLDAAKAAVNG